MGSSSVSTHRGLVHWQGLLLIVSLLNFWSQPTAAQVTVESKDALEGTDVRLRISPEVPNAEGFLWYRGTTFEDYHYIAFLFNISVGSLGILRGPSSGDVMVDDDGSLLLKNVTVKHSGIYTIVVELQRCQKLMSCGQLHVYPRVRAPILVASSTAVTENSFVLMSCYTDALDVKWLFKCVNLKLTERIKLSHDRRVLTIYPVRREDAGEYRCKASNPLSSRTSDPLKLDVRSG